MNFDIPDDCQAIAAEVRRVLAQTCPMDEVRRCLDEAAPSAATWRALADLGVLGSAVPERWGGSGGSGGSALALAACAAEIGWACAPVPMLASVYLATEALLMADDDALRERWLPGLAGGDLVGSVALAPAALHCRDGRLSGALPLVPAGATAAFVIVACDGVLWCVDLDHVGVVRRPLRVLDPGSPLAQIDLDGVPALVLGEAALEDTLHDRAAALLSMEQLGGADRALEMARAYALERRTFGRVVASYQAIKHKLADIWVKNEIARGHAWHAAWALAWSPPALPLAAASARLAASAAYSFAAQENLQVHGGIGFTWEADCHPLYKRARSSSLVLGAPAVWQRHLVSRLVSTRGGSDEL
ncbi:acyl-CoA dehydrogenase family protein [Roseateles toxinivorans]|uniref:Acyl-CoA dehydrogenase n=1 Tax=Roseateles toxinivorans TaxID=270368 RepID=A0A4R6QEK8_9BURK|nr:acyl-CoA dehydrogenase family protein [Roseateles toxinivorans]TDP60436.1 acyl-CoA dehydrogenase [Roseateles toxinivorans]